MAQTGDVIRITTFAKCQGQDVLNTWYYELNIGGDGGAPIGEIVTLWFTQFDVAINTYLSQELVYDRVYAENLTDGIEIFEGSVTANGDILGEVLPVHDTLSVKLIRLNKSTRSGRKSFSGLSEGTNDDGNVNLNATATDDIEDFCGSSIEVVPASQAPDPTFMNPVIVGRVETSPGVYELDLNTLNPIIGAKINSRVRTQNTRK